MKASALGACLLAIVAMNTALPQVTSRPSYTRLTSDEVRHLQSKGFGPTVPTPFQIAHSLIQRNEDNAGDEVDEEDIAPAQSQARRPVYSDGYSIPNVIPVQARPRPLQQYVQPQQQPQSAYSKSQPKDASKVEEEEEEPDRLSLLLPNSKFECVGKNTGYYADEDLQCEVFHYCQDNSKHSWICPEGFTFHQVHLICMPPGTDNICAKSSQFHFVNEYLYKPVNLEEHQRKPSVTLRYSDRYYPENFYDHNSYEEEEEDDEEERQYHHQRKPIRVGLQQVVPQQQALVVTRPAAKLRPAPTEQASQVFRSPEEINISLQQRKPQLNIQRYRDELAGF